MPAKQERRSDAINSHLAGEFRSKIKEYGLRGILNYGEINSDEFKSRWDKIDSALVSSIR